MRNILVNAFIAIKKKYNIALVTILMKLAIKTISMIFRRTNKTTQIIVQIVCFICTQRLSKLIKITFPCCVIYCINKNGLPRRLLLKLTNGNFVHLFSLNMVFGKPLTSHSMDSWAKLHRMKYGRFEGNGKFVILFEIELDKCLRAKDFHLFPENISTLAYKINI